MSLKLFGYDPLYCNQNILMIDTLIVLYELEKNNMKNVFDFNTIFKFVFFSNYPYFIYSDPKSNTHLDLMYLGFPKLSIDISNISYIFTNIFRYLPNAFDALYAKNLISIGDDLLNKYHITLIGEEIVEKLETEYPYRLRKSMTYILHDFKKRTFKQINQQFDEFLLDANISFIQELLSQKL